MQEANGKTDESRSAANWSAKLLEFRSSNGMSRKQLSDACGLSVGTIVRIERNNDPRVFEIRKLVAYFESLPVMDDELFVPRGGLDMATTTMMEKVVKLACENDRIAGMATFCIRHIEEEQGKEVLLPIATKLLRQYLTTMPSVEARMNKLFELYDVVKNSKGH